MEILQKNSTNNSFDPPLFLHSIVNFRTSFFDYIYIHTHTYTYKHELKWLKFRDDSCCFAADGKVFCSDKASNLNCAEAKGL